MHQYFEWIYLQYTGIPVASHSNFSLFWKQFQRTNGMAIRVCRKWIHPKQYKRLLLRYTGQLSCQHEKLFDIAVWTATAQNYNKSFPPIEHRIDREGLVHGIYFRLSWFQSSLLLIYFRYGGRDRRAQLHSVTEFAPRSPIFCVNRSSVWCGFCVRARPIRCSTNRALVFFKL